MTQSATTPATAEEPFSPSLRRLIVVVVLGALMMQLDMTMTNIATKTLLVDFGSTLATIQWVGTGYLLAMATTIPLAGWAMERYGARAVWLGCIGVFLAGSVLCGAAWSATSLIGFRVLQGFGAGTVLPVGQAVLAQAAGPRRLGRVMAALGIPAMLGPVLGPVLGGVLVDQLSWRWIFYVNVPVCLGTLILSWRAMPARVAGAGARLDLLGLLLLSPGCAAVVFGLAETSRYQSMTDAHVLVPLIIGVGLLAGFAVRALRSAAIPLIDLRLFRDRGFGSASATMFVSGFVLFGAMSILPLFYQLARGDSAQHAGLLLMPMGVGMGLALVLGGRLANRVAPRTMALAGLACTVAGTLVYTQLHLDTSNWLLGAAQVVSGAGIGATLVPIMSAAMAGLAPAAIPRASTGIRIMQQLGGSFGSAVILIVVQHQFAAHAATATGLTAAFAATYWWVLAFAGVLLIPTLFLPGRPIR